MNTGSPTHILLVEDSPTDVLLAREVVDTYPDFRLTHVQRLGEAIRAMIEGHFDVVLLDLGLPDSQGLATLLSLLRANPDVPVVVMTARDDEELALKAVHSGAQDYLVKSQVVNGVLGRAIRYAIERRHAEESRREQSALVSLSADVGLAFTRGGSLSEMLQHCAESLVRNLGAAFARIWTLNATENVLELRASAGMFTHIDGPHSQVPVGKHKIGLIAEERKPHLTNDVAHDPRISDPEWARREGMVAFAGYPLLLEDRLVGVMGMFARKRLTETTLQAMASVANQIALGVERKVKEEALRESEERFRELTAHIDQVLWMIDARESKILYVSPGYERMWGRSCQTLIDNPRSYMQGIHPLDQERMARDNAAMYQTGHIDTECRVLRPDESVRWAWIRGYPVKEQGQIIRLVGIMEDITEKRSLAAERDALLARLQLQIQRLPLIYILFDADFRITDWNPAAERTFGYTREEALGKQPNALNPPSFHQEGTRIMERIRAGDMAAHSVNDNRTNDGRTITCEWFNTPLMLDDGRFGGLLCLGRDVTEQKSLEAQFRQAQKMEAVGQLAGGVAHDFNNLVTIISGYSELLLSRMQSSDPMRAMVKAIGEAGGRAASLTRQLLAFSRQTVLESRVLDLNGVVRETEKMLRRLIGEDIVLTAVLDSQISRVKIDPGHLDQVLMNLSVNARDAMPKGGRITLETRNVDLDEQYADMHADVRAGRYVLLAVSDTGCGMTPETQARIFEPFYTTKGVGKGTGLGLSVVFGIVKQSGGHIEVHSELNLGTTFKLYFPAVEKQAEAVKRLDETGDMRGSETVLLVEDEDGVRGLALLVLQTHGYTVLEARNGSEALRVVEKYGKPIGLLLTDVVMPGMDGRDVAEALQPRFPQMKVLFTSGYTDDAVVRHGILQAEVAFIQKPYSTQALARKVRQVLGQT